jgi:hypothetical protein
MLITLLFSPFLFCFQILDSTVDGDDGLVASVSSKMRTVSNRAADVLVELGGKSPVSYHLVSLLHKMCRLDESVRVKVRLLNQNFNHTKII